MTSSHEPVTGQLSIETLDQERAQVLQSWETGAQVNLESGVALQNDIKNDMRFSCVLQLAADKRETLLQPRAGVALIREHSELLQGLSPFCDVLPTTVDAYTRHNRYKEAQVGIDRSRAAGKSLLNGFPLVNHGVDGCRRLIEAQTKPVQVRHGTPDARLLAEIAFCSGFTSFEGGGISYNIPYAKKIPLEKSIRDWQYCDRLVGYYEDRGVSINREPFGPLTGTLVPPFISNVVAILEGLLALEQGVRCITLGYGQGGNIVQDIAAIRTLRKLAHHYFLSFGYDDYSLSTVFHQWMGGFPQDEGKAGAVICLGALTAKFAGSTKMIVKTPHEASGIPTLDANISGLQLTRQMINMISEQLQFHSPELATECEIIEAEMHAVMRQVINLSSKSLGSGIVTAFEKGIIDIPFAPSISNAGQLTPIRDNYGAIRILEAGNVPFPKDVGDYHRDKIKTRATCENREPSFEMLVDDVNAISAGQLVGRPYLLA